MTRLLPALILCLVLPSTSLAALARSFATGPDTVFASNEVIDIIDHDGGIWMATSLGVNFTDNDGNTWLLYNANNGLPSEDISALFSMSGVIWVATNHQESPEGDPITYSDGLTWSDDDGFTWQTADFSPVSNFPGAQKTVFDITGHYDPSNQTDPLGFNDNWIFFSSFAAGLIGTRDGGATWRRIFASFSDSVNFTLFYQNEIPDLPLLNRHFSTVIDTSHGDTIILYAGTAGGTIQYIFPDPRDKPFVRRINKVAFCDGCTNPDSAFVFLGGEFGVMRGLPSGRGFMTRFVEDGLPGSYVSALIDFRGRLFVGTVDGEGGDFAGLAYSDDRGDSFYQGDATLDSRVSTDGGAITDFVTIGHRLYMAAATAGLFVSEDTGTSWNRIWIDSADTGPGNLINFVNALNPLGNDLLIGTDSGLARLYLDDLGLIDSQKVDTIFNTGFGLDEERITRVRSQLYYDSTDTIVDSVAIWTVNPSTASQSAYIHRALDTGGVLVWDHLRFGELVNDIVINADTTFFVSEIGIKYIFGYTGNSSPEFSYPVADSTSTDRFTIADTVTTMAFNGDQVVIGSTGGFALSPNRGTKHRIFRINQDTLSPDVSINYTYQTSGLGGNFVQSLGVQYLDSFDLAGGLRRIDSGMARIWISGSPTGVTDPNTLEQDVITGLSVGIMFPVDIDGVIRIDNVPADSIDHYQRIWALAHQSVFAWNFAFHDETVFAATDWGLVYFNGDIVNDSIFTWDTLDLRDADNNLVIAAGTPVYAVEVVDDKLWVGTEDGVARIDLTDIDLSVEEAFFVVDSTSPSDEVYAFPVPYRFSRSTDKVNFHYVVKEPANVTIEIYDFAMNLVSRRLDNAFRPARIYQTSDVDEESWDGTNDKGERVSVGIYYFKVEYSTGEQFWGKIAVMP